LNQEEAARLRAEYESEGLAAAEMSDNPFSEFHIWLSGVIAVGFPEPNSFVLATVGNDGEPSARAVLMKEFSSDGIVFYTNLDSDKSRDLKANPRAAATFVWIPLHRQVRFEGRVEEVESRLADAYFATRPRGAQIAAHASKQSRVVTREKLEATYAQLSSEFGDGEIPRPEDWGGWRIIPDSVEFWQGRPNRFHDRILYRLEKGGWVKDRLSP
jgi:pyridoxamine 5'-phosphate oxidase